MTRLFEYEAFEADPSPPEATVVCSQSGAPEAQRVHLSRPCDRSERYGVLP